MMTKTNSIPALSGSGFDITGIYNKHLQSQPPALAAISALTDALESHPLHTISETLNLLTSLSSELKSNATNSNTLKAIPFTAGTDTFQRWLITALGSQARHSSAQSETDFAQTKFELAKSARDFVSRGVTSKSAVVQRALPLICDGDILVIPAQDPVIDLLLSRAAATDLTFTVLLVHPSSTFTGSSSPYSMLLASLEPHSVPVYHTTHAALAHDLSLLPPGPGIKVLSGAQALLSTGGVLAGKGTQGAAIIARHVCPGAEVWVLSESWKGVRWFELPQKLTMPSRAEALEKHAAAGDLDITPPGLISGIIMDTGLKMPAAVAEESVKAWF